MKKVIEISGMTCGHCVHAVREALSDMEKVQVEDVSIGRAVVQADPSVTDEEIRAAIEEDGYKVTGVN